MGATLLRLLRSLAHFSSSIKWKATHIRAITHKQSKRQKKKSLRNILLFGLYSKPTHLSISLSILLSLCRHGRYEVDTGTYKIFLCLFFSVSSIFFLNATFPLFSFSLLWKISYLLYIYIYIYIYMHIHVCAYIDELSWCDDMCLWLKMI